MIPQQTSFVLTLVELAQKWHLSPRLLGLLLILAFKVVLKFICQLILSCLGYEKMKTVDETPIHELHTYGSVFPFLTPENYVTLARGLKGLTPSQVNLIIHKLEPGDRATFETTQAALEKLDPGTLARYRSETSETIYANRQKKTIVTVLYWLAVAFVVIYLVMHLYLSALPVIHTPSR